MSAFPRKNLFGFLGLLLAALAIMIAVALVTYSPWDNTPSVAGPEKPYSNKIGYLGAWTADILFIGVGFSAFLIPIPLLILSYRLIRSHPIEFPVIKGFGVLVIVIFATTIMELLGFDWPGDRNFMAGGVIGLLVGEKLQTYLNWTGSMIFAVAAFVGAVTLTTRFSLDAVLQWLSERKWGFLQAVPDGIRNWRANRQEERELERLAGDSKKIVAHPLPEPERMSFEELEQNLMAGRNAPTAKEPGFKPISTGSPKTVPDPQPAAAQKFKAPTVQEPFQPAAFVPPWEPEARAENDPDRPFRMPPIDFLNEQQGTTEVSKEDMLRRAETLTTKCAEFGVGGQVVNIQPGPVVTTFEFKPDPGVKYSKITSLSDDLCLALRSESVRIDRVPGKNTVGIEVPNQKRRVIMLREVLSSPEFHQAKSQLTLGLGQKINGEVFVADLAKMPHLLIAGATGTGKSVGLNCMVCSILYKSTPRDVKIIMVDPKRLELGLYENIPHLLTPIVTDPKKAANALQWAVREMEERYKSLARHGVRNIDQYNQLLDGDDQLKEQGNEHLPYIVVIVDELADLMMTAGKDVETAVTRLAQMARAVGIHLILATQRPSVDVITGLIKANFPSRISFRVSSKIDSRTILDMNGAEQLLGMGDSLFLSPQTSRLVRIHGGFVSEKEIAKLVGFLKEQAAPEYREEILIGEEDDGEPALIGVSDMEDKLYNEAAQFVVELRKASTSLLQRRFRIGYGRAARLLDMMEHEGLVGPSEGSRPREVLVPPNYFDEVAPGE